jgi:hypothetical protein
VILIFLGVFVKERPILVAEWGQKRYNVGNKMIERARYG